MIYDVILEIGPFKKFNIGYPFYHIGMTGVTIYRKIDNKEMSASFSLRVITKDNNGIPLPKDKYIYDTVDNYYVISKGRNQRYELREFYKEFSTGF